MNKTTLSFLIAIVVLCGSACKGRGTVIKKSISYSNNGNTLKVEVYAKIDGKKIHDFSKEFDVAGMDKEEREAIAKHIMDSVDLSDNAGK